VNPSDPALRGLRIAVVHDWLTGRRGGEKVLEEILEIFPKAQVHTLLRVPGAVPSVESRLASTSWLDRLGPARRIFPAFLPLFNRAIQSLELGDAELVLSVSHCAAKNVRPPPGVPHLCYCLTPARYAWDLYDDYAERALGRLRPLAEPLLLPLRDRWRREDRAGAEGVTRFIAISEFIAARIRRAYDRPSEVIHPPVDVAAFAEARALPSGRFLAISALRPNKRVEELAGAFRELALPIDIVGPGSPRARRRVAALGGSSVTVHGEISDKALRRMVAGCRALVHAATEDFGIAPVEAQAAGRPVIGFRRSGLADTVIDQDLGRTGVLFDDPSPKGIADAVRRFITLEDRCEPDAAREHAQRFSRSIFRQRLSEAVAACLSPAPC